LLIVAISHLSVEVFKIPPLGQFGDDTQSEPEAVVPEGQEPTVHVPVL
jgi:hypothetical protein